MDTKLVCQTVGVTQVIVRASPRVCQNLLSKSCVFPTSKKLCKVKKRIHLQHFGIIHLPNPDLTYIRNPVRNKIIYVPFHLLKNLHQESFLFFISFSPSHLEGNNDGNHDPRSHICAWGGEFCQISIFAKLICQTVGGQFFLF
jgi:hypothetical protein